MKRKDPREMTFPPVEATLPEIQEFTTSNGIQVIFIENHELPLVEVQAQLAGGWVYTNPDKAGLVNLFSDVLRTGGAGERSGDEINDYLESRAASIETWGGRRATGAGMSCLKEDFTGVLNVMGDIFAAPKFAQEKLELHRNLRLEQVRRENDNPQAIVSREFTKGLYPNSILGVHADEASYNGITRDDLLAFWKDYYHPNNVILSVTGDLTRQELESALNRVFGDWLQAELQIPDVPDIEPVTESRVILVKKELVQSNIRVGMLSPLQDTHPDRFAVSVMNYILGAGGFKSRLTEKIRSDEGLAYSVWSNFSAGWQLPGVFQAGTETKGETTHRALELLVQEITRMNEAGITPAEFDRARASIINRDVFKYDEPNKIARQLLNLKFEGKPQSYLTDAVKGYQSLTLEEVNAAARKYLRPEQLLIMVVGNPDLFEKPIDDFGKVTVIDLEQDA
ncbi:MAG: insulinase family protein [Candidatus Marinimicrobia bacterium]|nr:insulinase family protein [Candidatus Neomarinimicrobiota bacterium]MCF7806027.1 insulinase family protein [Candidatus Neomarinimicrobiota bacterium]MCF7840326.1 insulinase family protein [Candidatus Neomarinimicrobiota bacterium]MCF7902019.1 insulinase family protein [Candidatus Neomarinimicrobiota bacterium]